MKFSCKTCKYETDDKSNYNRHIKSVAHTQLAKVSIDISINANIERPGKFQCPNCLKNYSSAPCLSRHKNNNCKGKIIMEHTKKRLEQEFDEKLKQKELEIELKYSKQIIENMTTENKKIQEKADIEIKELKQYIKTNKSAPTYNISIKKLVQQNYPDAPYLAMLDDYTVIHEDEDSFTKDLVYCDKNNMLNSYLGDIIIKYYKKDNPKNQSLWSTDSSRLKYIIKELLASKKSSWSEDDKGLKINKYIIEPLLHYIHEYINEQIDKLDDAMRDPEANADKCVKLNKKQLKLASIREQIQNGQLKDAVNKYIAPSFRFNNDKLIAI